MNKLLSYLKQIWEKIYDGLKLITIFILFGQVILLALFFKMYGIEAKSFEIQMFLIFNFIAIYELWRWRNGSRR